MTGRMAGQTINDRLLAAKHSLAGQGLAKAVCKATTEEMIGPKKKHLDYLVHCTNEPNVSIPQLANLLIERSQNTNWVVVYKALLTVHQLMSSGNERFTQYLASSNSTFQLSNFLDKSGVQGILNVRTGYDMSPFIRRYARYLNEKAMTYRTLAFDFCKIKRGVDNGVLRNMTPDKLLKALPVLQNQMDVLLEFDCSPNDLTNGVINMCFMLLFKDLMKLFACYNDGIINLLEQFFDMNKKQCREALDCYKKFLIRQDKVDEFLKVAENVGIDKGDIPDLCKAPGSLLIAMESHLEFLEGKKNNAQASGTTSSHAASNQKNVKSGVSALSSTSNAFGNAVANGRFDSGANGIDEKLKLKALADEEAAMNQFKSKVSSPTASTASNSATSASSSTNLAKNPFLSNNNNNNTTSPINNNNNKSKSQTSSEIDLFTSDPTSTISSPPKSSDDLLLQLSNPFADAFTSPVAVATTYQQQQQQKQSQTPQPLSLVNAGGASQQYVATNNVWMTNGNGFLPQHPSQTSPVLTSGGFVSENNFASVFGNTEVKSGGFDPLGGVLQPMSANGQINNAINSNFNNNNTDSNSNHHNNQQQQQSNSTALLTGDLESSLASLAENLTINPRIVPVKGVQWNSPKNGSKANWTPQPMSATTGANYKPMNQSIAPHSSLTSQTVLQPQMFSPLPPMMAMRPIIATTPMIPQISPIGGVVPNTANQMGQQSLLFH